MEFLKNLARTGQIPQALKDRPKLKPWLVEYYEAFHILRASRPIGSMGGIGAIPLSEIASYIGIFEILDYDEKGRFIKTIKALDDVYVTHVNKKLKAERDKQSKQKGRTR